MAYVLVICFGLFGVLAGISGDVYESCLHIVVLVLIGSDETSKTLIKLLRSEVDRLERVAGYMPRP